MPQINIHKNQRGNLLMMALLAMTSIMIVTLATSALVINSLKAAGAQGFSNDAFFAAEAGAESILGLYKTHWYPNLNGCAVNQYVDIANRICQNAELITTLSNNASFSVQYTQLNPVKFKIRGRFIGHLRVIELTFND